MRYLTDSLIFHHGLKETMSPYLLFIILTLASAMQAIQDPPAGDHFVGVGYNILKGNPKGGDISIGGVDPGLMLTRKIFKLTYKKEKSSTNLRYRSKMS